MSANEFAFVKLTLKLKATPASTVVFYFSNREVQDDTTPGLYIPILESVNIGQALSDYLPQNGFGSITLINTPNSLTAETRFSDYLEVYAVANQTVELWVSNNTFGDDDLSANAVQLWTETISSYTFSPSGDKVILNLRSNILPQTYVTYEIDTSHTNLATYGYDEANGKDVPFVVGGASNAVEVPAIPLRDDSSNNGYKVDFAYATILSDDFTVGGIQKYYAKNDKDKYVEVVSTGGTTTNVYEWANDSSGGYIALHEGEEASRVNYTSSNYICTSAIITFRGDTSNTAVTFDGEVVFRLYKRRATGKPQKQPIEEVAVLKSDNETDWEAASLFTIEFKFSKPIVMDHEHGYFVSVSLSDTASNGIGYVATQDETGRVVQFRQDPSRSNKARWQAGTVTSGTGQETAKTFIMKFRGVKLTDYNTGNSGVFEKDNGLGLAYFTAEADTVTADDDIFNLKDLKLIVQTIGIRDNASGSISATANNPLTAFTHLVHLLCYEWSGTAWTVQNIFDTSFQSASHIETESSGTAAYYRIGGGATKGSVRRDQFIRDLAKNGQFRVCVSNGSTKKIGLYFMGHTQTSVDTLYDDDVLCVSLNSVDAGAIVNDCLFKFREYNVVPIEDDGITWQEIHYHYADGGTGESISDDSEALYGAKELKDNEFNWLNLDAGAQKVAQLILKTHDEPLTFLTIDLPLYENRTIKAMDALTIRTPLLPDEDGTTHKNTFNPLSKTNTFTNNLGIEIRSNSYKAQVINNSIIYETDKILKYRLVCKLITSSNDPT